MNAPTVKVRELFLARFIQKAAKDMNIYRERKRVMEQLETYIQEITEDADCYVQNVRKGTLTWYMTDCKSWLHITVDKEGNARFTFSGNHYDEKFPTYQQRIYHDYDKILFWMGCFPIDTVFELADNA